MKPTLLFATLSMVLAMPKSIRCSQRVGNAPSRCVAQEQEIQILQSNKENAG